MKLSLSIPPTTVVSMKTLEDIENADAMILSEIRRQNWVFTMFKQHKTRNKHFPHGKISEGK